MQELAPPFLVLEYSVPWMQELALRFSLIFPLQKNNRRSLNNKEVARSVLPKSLAFAEILL